MSEASLAAASTIVIASEVPAVSKFKIEDFSSSTLGLKIYFQSAIKANLQAQTGHSNGVQAIIKVKLAQTIHQKPNSLSQEALKTVTITWVSFTIPFGNIGLIGLSISLADKVASSEGLHSLFWNLFPQIFPVA